MAPIFSRLQFVKIVNVCCSKQTWNKSIQTIIYTVNPLIERVEIKQPEYGFTK